MPINRGTDSDGKFYRYGDSGKKYHYTTEIGRKRAKGKAEEQGRAVERSKHQRGGDNTGKLAAFHSYLRKEQPISKWLGRAGFSRLSTTAAQLGYGSQFHTLPYRPPLIKSTF